MPSGGLTRRVVRWRKLGAKDDVPVLYGAKPTFLGKQEIRRAGFPISARF